MNIVAYHVIDSHTGQVVKTYNANQGKLASRMVDRLDSKYGACRYIRKAIYND